jgi:hypothetical protein
MAKACPVRFAQASSEQREGMAMPPAGGPIPVDKVLLPDDERTGIWRSTFNRVATAVRV